MLDNSDFVDTDIPLEVPVPENQFLSVISLIIPVKTIFPSAIASSNHYKSDSSTQNHGPALLFDLQQCYCPVTIASEDFFRALLL